MVKLEEVTDEHFTAENEEEWDTDDESDASSITSSIPDESLLERLSALRDIVPARRRAQLSSAIDTSSSWLGSGLMVGGKAMWVLSTSALLLMVPWMLAYSDDQVQMEMEQTMKMQQSASEFMTPGAGAVPADGEKSAL
ncbi:mitochondrial import receptor subunit TOM22 [Microthyrium microscopicum]|uniref:Mitochondrial import receptor subunit TOM22 n=1 Tax=Microthyrium microscopicum TaxID=703497 RepID=A0A6A6UEM6_9PEZI|nr:mitochondrial import receptor subunit TOM22 [Microthyrium microscopicum]